MKTEKKKIAEPKRAEASKAELAEARPGTVETKPSETGAPAENPREYPRRRMMPNGGWLLIGPTNKGGPGRPPNELRRLARESLPKAIERATEIIESSQDTSAVIRAGEFLSKIGVPSQSEVIEIHDERLIAMVFDALVDLGCTPEFIESFKTRLESKAEG